MQGFTQRTIMVPVQITVKDASGEIGEIRHPTLAECQRALDAGPIARYAIVQGHTFRSYTGTTACTGLGIVGYAMTMEELRNEFGALLDEGGDLLLAIDLLTGLRVDP